MNTFREILDYLLEAGEAKTAYVPWGKNIYRNVIIFKGNKYLYKLTGEVNYRLGKIILRSYIDMSTSLQNTNNKLDEEHAVQVIFNIRFQNEDKHRTYSRDVFHVKGSKKTF